MLQRVLVPVEMSATDSRMAAFARGLAAYGVKELLLLHVADLTGVERPVAERHEQELRERLETLAASIRQPNGPTVHALLESGDAAHVILRNATQRNVDLIVCATRAKSVLDEFALGSVSEAIARRSDLPLLLVPFHMLASVSEEAAFENGGHAFDMVVHPTDFSDVSEHALDFLKRVGREGVGQVRLVHAMARRGLPEPERRAAERSSMRILFAMQAELAELEIPASTQIIHGSLVDSLMEVIEGEGGTCVAMGAQGHSMSQELLIGSVSLSVLRRSPVPVVLSR